MLKPLRDRSLSLSMVVLVLLIILILQENISYSVVAGDLGRVLRRESQDLLATGWLILRGVAMVLVVALWLLKRKVVLFKAIIFMNALLTIGLAFNVVALLGVLTGITSQAARTLLTDVAFVAITNILIFSIWYWIIDPPGVQETQRLEEPWDFLFPQRTTVIPFYESWQPRYLDYLYLAFTSSFAFSPTDTMPLTRRAKLLMLLQATISVITLTFIAGSAVNILAGSS